jgi:light-regulated signal transduction histidine kinase (bacteriophytochrome)
MQAGLLAPPQDGLKSVPAGPGPDGPSEVERFAYIAGHDLQEPVRMVLTYTELLAQHTSGKLDPDAEEFMAFALEGAQRLQRMINGILAYTRVDTNGRPLSETSSEAALSRALRLLGPDIDAEQLCQVFTHLLSNALKFRGQAPPCITIQARPGPSGSSVFSVRDNGIGIEAKHFARIFLMFQRLHAREAYEGIGTGLTLCERILTRHGGRIWVDSQPGQGSVFHFSLAGP